MFLFCHLLVCHFSCSISLFFVLCTDFARYSKFLPYLISLLVSYCSLSCVPSEFSHAEGHNPRRVKNSIIIVHFDLIKLFCSLRNLLYFPDKRNKMKTQMLLFKLSNFITTQSRNDTRILLSPLLQNESLKKNQKRLKKFLEKILV